MKRSMFPNEIAWKTGRPLEGNQGILRALRDLEQDGLAEQDPEGRWKLTVAAEEKYGRALRWFGPVRLRRDGFVYADAEDAA